MGNKGEKLEQQVISFLEWLFNELGYTVHEARKQNAGGQDGFDIKIAFSKPGTRIFYFYFECKNYDTDLSFQHLVKKVNQLAASNFTSDAFILISPKVDLSNIDADVIAFMEQKFEFPIKYWTPCTYIRETFALSESTFKDIYKEGIEYDTQKNKARLKHEIELLCKTDLKTQAKKQFANKVMDAFELIVNGLNKSDNYPKDLTNQLPRVIENEIIGRESDLEKVRKLLCDNKSVVVVNGIGGIGKSTLAQTYLTRYYNDYQHVAWITQSGDNIVADIATSEMPRRLNIDTTGMTQDDIFNEVIHKLRNLPSSPNLLILDNTFENLGSLKDYLPHPPQWHVLTTSRHQIEGFKKYELGFLTEDEALQLFKMLCTLMQDDAAILELVRMVDCHTLIIELLAKAAKRQHKTIAQLKAGLKEDMRANVQVPHNKEGKVERINSYVTSIFNMSALNGEEQWMMKQFACLPAEFQSYELLVELMSPDGEHVELFSETLTRLTELGWLIQNADTQTYKLHKVIQDVVRKQLVIEESDVEGLVESLCNFLSVDQTKDNPVDKFKWIPFGEAVLDVMYSVFSRDVALLQNNLGLVYRILGNAQKAELHLRASLKICETIFGEMHFETATRYSNLALVLKDLGDLLGARELTEKAIASNEKNFGFDHPNTSTSYSNLALVLQYMGDFQGAKELLEKAVNSDEKYFGVEHPITAIRYSNLAVVLQCLGDSPRARALLVKAVVSFEKNLGFTHPSTVTSYSNLALVLQDSGDFQGAKELLEKAVASDEKNFGLYHSSTAVSYSNLALVHKDLGEFNSAKELLEKAVASNEKNFGFEHPTTTTSYSNLAMVLQDMGELKAAAELMEKVLTSTKKNYGTSSPTVATRYHNLASVVYYLKDFRRAVDLELQALEIWKKALPSTHPHILFAEKQLHIYSNALKNHPPIT